MCYKTKNPDNIFGIEMRFNAEVIDDTFDRGEVLGFDHPKMAIIRDVKPDKIISGEWGLIPGFARDKIAFREKTNTLNCMIEEAHEKNSYRKVLDNRCLILVDAFLEYKHINDKAKTKQLHEIFTPDRRPFAIAGLWNDWNDPNSDEILTTITLLTTTANELMATIHNSKKRMPVILLPEEEKIWLSREKFEPYFKREEVELIAIPLTKLPEPEPDLFT